MKIVINSRYGGFSLSPAAVTDYLARKGKECHIYTMSDIRKNTMVRNMDGFMIFFFTSDHGETWEWSGETGDDYFDPRDISRDDPDLVAVVETLGAKANDQFAALVIVEIPDDVEWDIEEYDGLEWVAERHRTWP